MVSAPPPIGLATFSANAPVTTRVPAYAARLRVRGAVSVRVVVAPATGPVVVNGADTAAAKKADSVMVQPAKARVPAPASVPDSPVTISAVAPPRVRVLPDGTVNTAPKAKVALAPPAVTVREEAEVAERALDKPRVTAAPIEIAPSKVAVPEAVMVDAPLTVALVRVTRFAPVNAKVPLQALRVGNVTALVVVSTVVVAPDGPFRVPKPAKEMGPRTVQPEKRPVPAPVTVPVTVTPAPNTTVVVEAAVTVPVEVAEVPVMVRVPALQFTAPLIVAVPSTSEPVAAKVAPPLRVPEATVTVPPFEVITEFTPVVVTPADSEELPDRVRNAFATKVVVLEVSKKPPLTTSVAGDDTEMEGTANAAPIDSVAEPVEGPVSGTPSALVLNVPAASTAAPVAA
jgi:hypothetical protein